MALVGINYHNYQYKLYNDLMINVKFVDTNGSEKYRLINTQYCKFSDSIILVYDVSDKRTFEECKDYYRDKIKEISKNNIKVLLIGNKIDLEDKREVTTEEGINFAFQNGYMFMETSCFKNYNIYESFEVLIYETLLIKMEEEEEEIKKSIKKKD